MSHIADTFNGLGYLPLQHKGCVGQGWDLALRDSVLCIRSLGRERTGDNAGAYLEDPDARGDLNGAVCFTASRTGGRKFAAWNFAFPSIIVGGGDSTKSAGVTLSGAGAAGGGKTSAPTDAAVLPIRGMPDVGDTRFEPKLAVRGVGRRKLPLGTLGVTVGGTEEDHEVARFMTCDDALVAVNFAGDPEMGSRVYDLTKTGALDTDRWAPLQSAFRVLRNPVGLIVGPLAPSLYPGENTLALQLSTSGLGDTFGGLAYDADGGNIAASLGKMSYGPIDVGGAADPHQHGVDADGHPINSAHLSLHAYIRSFDGAFDGPNLHNGAWQGAQDAPYSTLAFYEWDGSTRHRFFGETRPGHHRWRAKAWKYEPSTPTKPPPTGGPPPKEPPKEPPPTPTGGPPTQVEPPPVFDGDRGSPYGYVAPGSLKFDPATGKYTGDILPGDSGFHGGDKGAGKNPPAGANPGGVVNVGWGPKIKPWKWKGLRDLFHLFGGDLFKGWRGGTPNPPSDGASLHDRVKGLDLSPLGPPVPPKPGDSGGEDPTKPIGPLNPPRREKVGVTKSPGFDKGDLGLRGGIPPDALPKQPRVLNPTDGLPTVFSGVPAAGAPVIGSRGAGEYRRVSAEPIESLAGPLSFRPQSQIPGVIDFRNWMTPDPAAQRIMDHTTPVVGHLEPYGAQGGTAGVGRLAGAAGAGDPWVKTLGPGVRYPGGTAAGGVCFMPPEQTLTDLLLNPSGVTKSTAYFTFAPGTYSAWGTPDLAGGGIITGHRVGVDSSGNTLFSRVSAAAVATGQLRLDTGGSVTVMPLGTSAGETGDLRFLELAANGTNYIAIKAADSIAATSTWVLPDDVPAAGDVLSVTSVSSGNPTLNWTPQNETGVIKTSAQSVSSGSSGTTLVDVTTLLVSIPANTNSKFEFNLGVGAAMTTTGIKVAVTVPAGATLAMRATMIDTGGSSMGGGSTVSGTAVDFQAAMFAGTTAVIRVQGTVLNGANAGSIQLQFAQSTASASNTTILAGADGNFTRTA